MQARKISTYRRIVWTIYLLLPYTLARQFLFYRIRKPGARLPDFLCIGTQKSGTTWLHRQLEQNPEICLAREKEVHYFDWSFHRSLRWYASRFSCGEKNIRGEITPGYSIIEKGRIRFIRRIMPGVRLVLLLRDPRLRAWSSARYHFGKQLGRDLQQVSPEEYIAHFQTKWVRERGDYERIWKNWSSVFPRNQLLVVFTEEIAEKPVETLRRISTFIGVEAKADERTLLSRPNASEALEMPPEVKKFLDAYYAPLIRRMPGWLGMENKYWKD